MKSVVSLSSQLGQVNLQQYGKHFLDGLLLPICSLFHKAFVMSHCYYVLNSPKECQQGGNVAAPTNKQFP
ncbi:unnamed protein product [Brugia timori]|uniref:Ovule protein n=1 Tax=Brugia timori TaxID=42155 RepID=A0A0R3Q8D5_9BILA|nr:unnamed protein product [Brugia timori]